MNDKPSFLTSTTAIAFLVTVAAGLGYALLTRNTDIVLKLIDMIVPAYIGVKGYTMGKNGGGTPDVPKT